MRGKKNTAILMILALTFTVISGGCRNQPAEKKKTETDQPITTDQSKTGRFFENEIPLPEGIRGIQSLRKLSDGSLEAIGTDNSDQSCHILQSTDRGQNWKQTELSDLPQNSISHTAIAPDGTAALIHYAKKGKITLTQAGTDGKTKDISVQFPGKMGNDIQVLQASYNAEGTLFLRMQDGFLYTMEPDGHCKKTIDTNGSPINYFSIAENTLVAVHEEGIHLFDTVSGKKLPEEKILLDLIQKNKEFADNSTDRGTPMVFSAGTEENSLFFANKNGIFHFTLGGSVMEQLMDGQMTSLGSGNIVLYDMVLLDQNNILIATNQDHLYHYSYDEKAASIPNQELTVYALEESIYLRQAVILFQKQYPDIHINLEIGLSGKDGVTLADALSVLNTNILAGKGPDVLILDGMPTDRYIEKGVLEDISDVISELDKKDGFFPNIVAAGRQKDAIYALPSRILITILEGDKEMRQSAGSLEALAKKVTELQKNSASSTVNTATLKGPESLLRDLFYADSASWMDTDGRISSDALTDYLRYAKQIYDSDAHDNKEEDRKDQSTGSNGTLESGEKLGTHQYYGLLTGEWRYSYGTVSDIFELQTLCSSRKKSKTDYCLLNGDQVKSYLPYLTVGVTKGGNTDASKNFIRVLLGKEAESSESNGIPVNRAAFDALCKEKLDAQNVKDDVCIAFSAPDSDQTYGFDYVNLTQKDIDTFTGIIESLNQPAMTDQTIQDIVLEQGKKYLRNQQELEAAVDAILKKVNLYLTE